MSTGPHDDEPTRPVETTPPAPGVSDETQPFGTTPLPPPLPPTNPYEQPAPPPPYAQASSSQPPYGQPYDQPYSQPGAQPPYGQPLPPPPYGPVAYGVTPSTPYGIHPATGIPYSDKNKIVAGLLNIFLPFGIGRFYTGDTRLGVLQLLVTVLTCGIGSLWSLIDGIILIATDSRDANGYVLRS